MKRKWLSQYFAFGILLVSLLGCQLVNNAEGEEKATGNWLVFKETQCADPWGYCNKSPDKTVCVKEHLENLGVAVLAATVEGSRGTGAACAACQCTTGRLIKVRVNPQDEGKVLALGFYRQ